ncbi:MAG: Hsp20/alpha crystallin family protein [Sphingomonas sp.]
MNDLTPAPMKSQPAVFDQPLGWLRSEIDRLFEDFRRPARSVLNLGSLDFGPVPAIEMNERDKDYRLTAELPGMKEDDIAIAVADGEITISGEKREETERKDKGFMLSERRYGAFERRIPLPADVDTNKISAEFSKGVLEVTLPKDAEIAGRTRRIEVKKG